MRFSMTLIPTLREDPADADAVSHKLLIRAGYVRQLASGLYIYLPLAIRVLNKINNVIREEMNRIGGQEVSMPVLHPAEVWQATGRWDAIGPEMFRLKDRTGRDMCLAMTHEEIMTWLAVREIRSYRDMPQIWYQIQTKLRDEARPKSGILRTREFIMKDSYSFDMDEEGLQRSYDLHIGAYDRIFKRCGLNFVRVDSDPGMMGGAMAHEYMAYSQAGEDEVALCNKCGYAANVELAQSVIASQAKIEMEYREVHTPGKKTVEEISGFLGYNSDAFIKSLLVITPTEPVLVLVRGDRMLHEMKLQRIIGEFRHARRDEIPSILSVEAGFIGPVGHKRRIIADRILKTGVYVSGANRSDYHLEGIVPGRHFDAQWEDITLAASGDGCPMCSSFLRVERVIEIGNIFKLGTKYTKALNAVYLDKDGNERLIIMGSYGIGPARVAAAAVEQNNDTDGIIWPKSIAPYNVHIIPLNMKDTETVKTAESIYNGLSAIGIDPLLDDRDERPGVKFKDADLIGIPIHIIIGQKGIKEGIVEIKDRRMREIMKVGLDDVKDELKRIIGQGY